MHHLALCAPPVRPILAFVLKAKKRRGLFCVKGRRVLKAVKFGLFSLHVF